LLYLGQETSLYSGQLFMDYLDGFMLSIIISPESKTKHNDINPSNKTAHNSVY